MSFRICTDIGGTFTDVVVADETGNINIFKSLTTPENRVLGVLNGLQIAADFYQKPLHEFMGSCTYFGHGTTTSTNALIEGKVAKVGLICTKGFRDTLLFREGGKESPFDWYIDYPEPFIPRYLTLPVTERINAEGEVSTPLDEDEVRDAIRLLRSYNVEVIAVSLFWSFVNPAHELRIGEIIEEEWPEITYTLSHVVNPRIREYRRTVSTVIDASLKPLINHYVSTFEESLRNIGYKGELNLLTCAGGVLSPKAMMERPVYSLDSGPALAPVAGKFYAEKELNKNNVITCDMGGTSFDMSRITDGEISISNESIIHKEKISISKVNVKTIGAGGGSIAWVDKGGLLHIGPEGAGAVPGPACYIRGGEKATITDANLVLGYLDEDYFLGGTMKVDKQLAEHVIMENVAKPLNLSLTEAAYSIYNAANHIMTEAIRDITVWEGFDPKEYSIVAGGGAVGMHINAIVSQLGCNEIIIPNTASTLSAFGGLVADVVTEYSKNYLTTASSFDINEVNDVLKHLREEATEFLNKVGISKDSQRLEFFAEARYMFQDTELSIPLMNHIFSNKEDVARFVKEFHLKHDQVLGSKEEGQDIEIVTWKVVAKGITPKLRLNEQSKISSVPIANAKKQSRKAFFKVLGGMVDVSVFDGELLNAGNLICGPAIIELPTTNIVVMPGSKATVSKLGNIIIEVYSTDKTMVNNDYMVKVN